MVGACRPAVGRGAQGGLISRPPAPMLHLEAGRVAPEPASRSRSAVRGTTVTLPSISSRSLLESAETNTLISYSMSRDVIQIYDRIGPHDEGTAVA
jgi:hypothetical protein